MRMPARFVATVGIALIVIVCVAPSSAEELKGQSVLPKLPGGVAGLSLEAPVEAAPKGDPSAVIQSIDELMKGYQEENAALRLRVEELEKTVERLMQNRTVTVLPQPGVPAQVPPSWKPFRFGDMTYYLVPLGGGGVDGHAAPQTLLNENVRSDGRAARLPAAPAPNPK